MMTMRITIQIPARENSQDCPRTLLILDTHTVSTPSLARSVAKPDSPLAVQFRDALILPATRFRLFLLPQRLFPGGGYYLPHP